MKEFPDIEVVSENQHGGETAAKAQDAASSLLSRFIK